MRHYRAIWHLLSPANKRRYLGLQAYYVLMGFLQVAGVGSIAPLIAMISDPSLVHRIPLAERAYLLLGFSSDQQFLVGAAVGSAALLALSNLIAAGSVWATHWFAHRVGVELKRDLYVSYLLRDYVLLPSTNSATLTANVQHGSNRIVFGVLQPALWVVSQGMVVLAVIVVLTVFQPVAALSVALFVGSGYLMLFLFMRRRLSKVGDVVWAVANDTQRLLSESFGGLKQIRLLGMEPRFIRRFTEQVAQGIRAEASIGLLGELPRFALETVTISAMLGLTIVMLRRGVPTRDIVALLSLFAMAGYRLLPAAQNIFKNAATLRSNVGSALKLVPDVLEGRRLAAVSNSQRPAAAAGHDGITVTDVWFCYPRAKAPVLRGVSATIPPNALTVITGPSGSGKSTLADLLLGLLRPERGAITVAGRRVHDLGAAWQRRIGYVPQSIHFKDDTIAANIAYGEEGAADAARLRRAARLAGLEGVVDALPEGFEARVGEGARLLSGGQQQRVGIARALYRDPDILIMDEATSALDGAAEHEVLESLLDLRREKTVVMIAHRQSTIRAADHIILLVGGVVEAEGDYGELMERSEGFRRLMRRVARRPLEATATDAA